MTFKSDWITSNDPVSLRHALASFPTGITIVTGVTPAGIRFGLTASSFQSVSLSPPLILYSIRKGAASIELIKTSQRFCVNVLRESHAHLATRFAAPLEDRFAGLDWHESTLGLPVLPDAIVNFECRLWAMYDGGDHEIVVGQVSALRHVHEADPLVRFRGEFRAIGPASQVSHRRTAT
jgi:flavin reductase (DIM6/NTAB) family NADH-FMN oxidoreductase RutF